MIWDRCQSVKKNRITIDLLRRSITIQTCKVVPFLKNSWTHAWKNDSLFLFREFASNIENISLLCANGQEHVIRFWSAMCACVCVCPGGRRATKYHGRVRRSITLLISGFVSLALYCSVLFEGWTPVWDVEKHPQQHRAKQLLHYCFGRT